MSVRTTDKTTVALYCSATGVAFGPVFESEDDAEEFLAWVEPKTFLDVRVIPRGELVALFRSWSAGRERDRRDEDGPTDDEIYNRVGVEGGIAYDTSADEPGSLGENDWRL